MPQVTIIVRDLDEIFCKKNPTAGASEHVQHAHQKYSHRTANGETFLQQAKIAFVLACDASKPLELRQEKLCQLILAICVDAITYADIGTTELKFEEIQRHIEPIT